MDEKELKIKAMEITRDIVVELIKTGKFDHITEKKVLSDGRERAITKYNETIKKLISDIFEQVYSSITA